jgi:phosphatidylglycerol lysyltransferase
LADWEAQKAQHEKQTWVMAVDNGGLGMAIRRRSWVALTRDGPVWLLVGVAFVNALLQISQALVGPDHQPWAIFRLLPFGLHYWNRSLSLIFGFALLYLSFNLLRRKRVAWWIAVLSSAVAALGYGVYGLPWYAVSTSVMMLGLLLIFRNRFTVHSEPRSITRGLGVVGVSVVLVLAYGTAGFWLLDEQDFGIDFHLSEAFVRTLRAYTLVGNDDLVARTYQGTWFLSSLGLAGLIVGGFAAYSLFRPLAYRLGTLPNERQEAKTILEGHGTSSLDFFKLWPDKSYFFSENRETFIAYKQAAGVAIALGDPVGPEQELEATTQAFVRYCSENGWSVAFHEVLPSLLPMYRRLGLRVLKIGEEAIVDLEHFRSHTAERKSFRRIRRKFESEGYRLIRYAPPHPWALLNEVEEISQEWLSLPGRRERSFTLGSFERSYLGETLLFVVRDPHGHPLAFVNEIPSYREGEVSIDLMRYRLEIPNGTMEYLLME